MELFLLGVISGWFLYSFFMTMNYVLMGMKTNPIYLFINSVVYPIWDVIIKIKKIKEIKDSL